jgi:hypothetical protein
VDGGDVCIVLDVRNEACVEAADVSHSGETLQLGLLMGTVRTQTL